MALLTVGLLSGLLAARGLFGTDYFRASVVRVIPASDPAGGMPRCLVSRPDGREGEAIICRGDNTKYNPGDRITVCQPFGPSFVIPGIGGVVYFGMSRSSLPATVLGLVLLIAGVAARVVKRTARREF